MLEVPEESLLEGEVSGSGLGPFGSSHDWGSL